MEQTTPAEEVVEAVEPIDDAELAEMALLVDLPGD